MYTGDTRQLSVCVMGGGQVTRLEATLAMRLPARLGGVRGIPEGDQGSSSDVLM